MQFVYRNLNYSMVLSCKINSDFSGGPNQLTFEIANSDSVRPRIETIVDRSIEKLERSRNTWKQILRAKVEERGEGRPTRYSDIVKSSKNELRSPLIIMGQHQLFDDFMNNEEDIERGSLYMSPTT